ncbi:phosphotransferase [Streptomyces beigongshangae]|uniref:phosphotransferase n=1 Tax=Streptomyces beigongshangae TaxID=2841597 RepID=UPI001C84298C|nr:phosphotransferase [Streptomyces sp. REN17]
MRSVNFSAIPMERGGALCLLVLDDGTRWGFPDHRHSEPDGANSWVRDRWGVEVGVLDALRLPAETSAGGGADAPAAYLFVHEARGAPAALPAGARWAPVAELADPRRARPGHHRMLGLWSADRDHRERDGWLPWQHPGWFAMAVAWAVEELRGLGIETVGPVRQDGFRAWSAQLLFPTSAGLVHLKASPPPHAHEPALTRLLAGWFPGAVPSVLAWDTGRRLMLTSDFGPVRHTGDAARTVADFRRVARRIGLIQRESAARSEEIAATGCPGHRLARLPDLFENLVAQVSAEPGGLTPQESAGLRRLAPDLARDCARLELLGIPDSLVHHDLWRGNFRVDGDDVLLFDWADSVSTHPFLQLDVLLRDLAGAPGQAAAREEVIDSYLAVWAGRRPPAELREGVARAAAVAPISRALLMRDRLAGAPPRIRHRYRGAVAAPLRACLAGAGRGRTPHSAARGNRGDTCPADRSPRPPSGTSSDTPSGPPSPVPPSSPC